MAKQFTLGKKERLKSRRLIEELFSKGRSFNQPPLRVVYMNMEKGLQAAVGVSTRHFKKSVDRNRIKRLIREAYRLQKNSLQDVLQQQGRGLILFFTFTSKLMPDYATVNGAVQKSLNKLIKTIHEKGVADS